MADVEIRNNPEQNRYEAWLGDELAGFAEYELRDDESITFVHTEVDDKFEGEGVGSTLARDGPGRRTTRRRAGGRREVPVHQGVDLAAPGLRVPAGLIPYGATVPS